MYIISLLSIFIFVYPKYIYNISNVYVYRISMYILCISIYVYLMSMHIYVCPMYIYKCTSSIYVYLCISMHIYVYLCISLYIYGYPVYIYVYPMYLYIYMYMYYLCISMYILSISMQDYASCLANHHITKLSTVQPSQLSLWPDLSCFNTPPWPELATSGPAFQDLVRNGSPNAFPKLQSPFSSVSFCFQVHQFHLISIKNLLKYSKVNDSQ